MSEDERTLSEGQGGRRPSANAVVLIALAVLVIIVFWQVIGGGRVFFFRDFGFYFYPKRHLVAQRLRSFDIPLWNRYGGCGEPVLGSYQGAVFYPLAVVYYLLPLPYSLMWFVVLHVFISGAGTHYLMRALGVRRAAAAATAVAWAFSPVFLSVIDNVSFMTSLAWMPWCLFFGRRLQTGGGLRAFAGLVITFAMAVLAGGPEPVIFTGAVVVFFVAFGGGGGKRISGRSRRRGAALAIGAIAVGILVAGVEVVPLLYAVGQSARTGLGAESAEKWAARPSDSILWLLPRFWLEADRGGIYWSGQNWLKTVYMGALIPFAALWTAVLVRRRRNVFFVFAAVVGMLAALGAASPVWGMLRGFVPGFALMRYPVKWFVPAAFMMVVLAGFGIDDLAVCARRGDRRRPAALVAGVVLVALLFAAGWYAMTAHRGRVFEAVTATETLTAIESGDEAAGERARVRFDSARWSLGRSAVFLAAGATALGVVFLFGGSSRWRRWAAAGTAAVIFADIALFAGHLNPVTGGGDLHGKSGAHRARAERVAFDAPLQHAGFCGTHPLDAAGQAGGHRARE